MKKYLIISVIIHILIIPVIIYSALQSRASKDDYNFEVTINTTEFNADIIINEEVISKISKAKSSEVDSSDLPILEMDNTDMQNKIKTNSTVKNEPVKNNDEQDNKKNISEEEQYYIDIMSGNIDGYKLPMPKYPASAKKWGYAGTTIVNISIEADGNIDSVEIVQSSGYSILDREVVSTIKNKWKSLPKMGKHIVVPKAFKFEIVN